MKIISKHVSRQENAILIIIWNIEILFVISKSGDAMPSDTMDNLLIVGLKCFII